MMINKPLGFTLFELLLTLMIITITVSFSIPALTTVFNKTKAHNETRRLFHLLQFARSEAIKRNQIVTVCPSNHHMQCESNWSHPIVVFVTDRNTHQHKLLRTVNISRAKSFTIHSGQLSAIRYSFDGSCLTRGTIYVQDNATHYKIVIYDSGRARIEQIGHSS